MAEGHLQQRRAQRWNVFELPKEILESIQVRRYDLLAVESDDGEDRQVVDADDNTDGGDGQIGKRLHKTSANICSFCGGIALASVEERRQHVKTDWHRYNVKRRLEHGKSVNEDAFNAMVEQLDESLSGSGSSSSEAGGSEDDDEEGERFRKGFASSPLAWFQVDRQVLANTQLGIYKALFPKHIPPNQFAERLKTMQLSPSDQPRQKIWTMLMTGGGHFAGMVVSLVPKFQGKERQIQILAHKTFHRYTTRRKQGGGQSANDNAKSKAKSAGAQLRRYNEQALQEDIRKILDDWTDYLDDSQLIFLRAPTRAKSIFVGYDEAIIEKDDPRLVTFPFPTRRPTLNELSRCFGELTRCKVTTFTPEELQKRDQEYLDRIAPRQPVKPKAVDVSKSQTKQITPVTPEDEKEKEREWMITKLLDLIKRDKADLLRIHLERFTGEGFGVNDFITSNAASHGHETTFLHHASSNDRPLCLSVLLDEYHADPTLLDSSNRTAYEVALTKACRNVFRRAMADRPQDWSWIEARVPSGLTRAMEEEQEKKAQERRRKERERSRALRAKREEEAEEKEKQRRLAEERQRKNGTATAVNPFPLPHTRTKQPAKSSSHSSSTLDQLTLTPEQRLRIERERRARAAEARMKK